VKRFPRDRGAGAANPARGKVERKVVFGDVKNSENFVELSKGFKVFFSALVFLQSLRKISARRRKKFSFSVEVVEVKSFQLELGRVKSFFLPFSQLQRRKKWSKQEEGGE
jgi:hypothetical protein